jgi:hypothetical protein
MIIQKIVLVFSSAFLFLTSAFGVFLNTSNAFAQETATTDGNIHAEE